VDRLEVFGSAAKGLFDLPTVDLDLHRADDAANGEPGLFARRFCSFADGIGSPSSGRSGGSPDGIHDPQSPISAKDVTRHGGFSWEL